MIKRCLLYIALILSVASCGFRPLYVEKTSQEDKWYFDGDFDNYVADQMAQVKVVATGERLGQLIRTNLLDLLTPQGAPKHPKYTLYVTLNKPREYNQALENDITATRRRIDYKAQYYMNEGTNQVLKGNTVAYVSYNILENPYSTVMAKKKVGQDAAKMMANDIALRLGAFFHAKANEYQDIEQKDFEQEEWREDKFNL